MLYAYLGVYMAKSLLIVESPTKMKTLSKFLGKDFTIKATYGHIKDLPKSKIGVDVEKDFTPHFLILKGKGKAVDEIKKASKNADRIYIGSDPDREGEAIAFHVAEVIGSKKEVERVLFHEITKKGVLDALKKTTTLDEAKYNAQKARRILDRLVGYKISPVLWEKVSYGLSAGRVQSVALRLVCDREEEIEAFEKEEFWVIDGEFKLPSGKTFKATLERKNDSKLKISSQDEAEKINEEIHKLESHISKIEIKDRIIRPLPGFITSKLQQEASRRFRFSPKKTMLLAQKLYEGIEIGGEEGVTGLITYMRTDSVRVSDEAIQDARQYIDETYGKTYLPKTPNYYKNKKTAQDAHEAIRPAYVHITPENIKKHLEKDLFLLYELIWKRFMASQMSQQKIKTKTIHVAVGNYGFIARGSEVVFDGFTRIYEEEDEDKEVAAILPGMKEGEKVSLIETNLNQRFTNPPPRFTEASLIKMLESKGIGRPSTYANIVSTIQERSYTKKEKGKLMPNPLGMTVNRLLKKFFPLIVDVSFSAKMEERLDLIENGKKNWVKSLEQFNNALESELSLAKTDMKSLKKEEKETDIICDKCGKKMLLRWGKNGEYIVCSGKPQCKNKKNVKIDNSGKITIAEVEIKGICPQCGGNLIEKRGRFGRFFACSNYPDCKYTESYSLGFPCPLEGCTGKLVEKISKKKRKFISCSRYPDCSFASNAEPMDGPCPVCSAPTIFTFRKKNLCLRKDCGWKS